MLVPSTSEVLHDWEKLGEEFLFLIEAELFDFLGELGQVFFGESGFNFAAVLLVVGFDSFEKSTAFFLKVGFLQADNFGENLIAFFEVLVGVEKLF